MPGVQYAPTMAALLSIGQQGMQMRREEHQRERERARNRSDKMAGVGSLIGLGAALTIPGAQPYAAALMTGGGMAGRAISGEDYTPPNQGQQIAMAGLQTIAGVQAAGDRSAISEGIKAGAGTGVTAPTNPSIAPDGSIIRPQSGLSGVPQAPGAGSPRLQALLANSPNALATLQGFKAARDVVSPPVQARGVNPSEDIIDQSGNLIRPGRPGAGGTAGQKIRTERISDARRLYGLNEADAVGLVDGHAKITTTQQGQLFFTNEATQEARQITPAQATPEGASAFFTAAAKPDVPTLYEVAGDSAGIVNSAKELYSDIAGQLGLPIYGKTVRARAMVRQSVQELVRTLTNSPKFPVAEADRINESIKFDPSFKDSPDALRERQVVLDQTLDRIGQKQLVESRRTDISLIDQSHARRSYADIQNFRKHLGAGEGFRRGKTMPQQSSGAAVAAESPQKTLNTLVNTDTAGMTAKELKAHNDEIARLMGGQ